MKDGANLLHSLAVPLRHGRRSGCGPTRRCRRGSWRARRISRERWAGRTYHAALMQRLGALGWHEGTNLQVNGGSLAATPCYSSATLQNRWRSARRDTCQYQPSRSGAQKYERHPHRVCGGQRPRRSRLRRELGAPGGNLTGSGLYDPPTVVNCWQC